MLRVELEKVHAMPFLAGAHNQFPLSISGTQTCLLHQSQYGARAHRLSQESLINFITWVKVNEELAECFFQKLCQPLISLSVRPPH